MYRFIQCNSGACRKLVKWELENIQKIHTHTLNDTRNTDILNIENVRMYLCMGFFYRIIFWLGLMVDLTTWINLFAFASFQMFGSFFSFTYISIFILNFCIYFLNRFQFGLSTSQQDSYTYHTTRNNFPNKNAYNKILIAYQKRYSCFAIAAKKAKVHKWWWMHFCSYATIFLVGMRGMRKTHKICLRVFDWRFPMERKGAYTNT